MSDPWKEGRDPGGYARSLFADRAPALGAERDRPSVPSAVRQKDGERISAPWGEGRRPPLAPTRSRAPGVQLPVGEADPQLEDHGGARTTACRRKRAPSRHLTPRRCCRTALRRRGRTRPRRGRGPRDATELVRQPVHRLSSRARGAPCSLERGAISAPDAVIPHDTLGPAPGRSDFRLTAIEMAIGSRGALVLVVDDSSVAR